MLEQETYLTYMYDSELTTRSQCPIQVSVGRVVKYFSHEDCLNIRTSDIYCTAVVTYVLEKHPAAADVVEDGLHDPARADEAAAAGAPNSINLNSVNEYKHS